MVLEFKSPRELEKLIRFPYYMGQERQTHATIQELQDWSEGVELHMYYCGGSVYFKDKEDLMAFQLRWI